jgi:sugar (pentulose or hexulose) kinase
VPPGSRGLLFFPYLLGERTMGSSSSRGSFIGLTPAHGRPEMVRAVLEGLCLELRRTLELIVPPDGVESVRITGGGALSDLWNQIRADTWDTRIRSFAQFEGGLVGAGILGGVGAGWYADPASAAEGIVQLDGTWDPDSATRRVYDGAYREFCAVHDLLDARWRTWET